MRESIKSSNGSVRKGFLIINWLLHYHWRKIFLGPMAGLFVAFFFVSTASASAGCLEAAIIAVTSTQSRDANAEIRKWYKEQIAWILKEDQLLVSRQATVKERAEKAYARRRELKLKARDRMQNVFEVELLRQRDREKYNDQDGPSFDALVQSQLKLGKSMEDTYLYIIDSSTRTSRDFDAPFGM